MTIYTLVLGDWSHDGHGMTEKYTVSTNTDDLQRDYQAGVGLLEKTHGGWIRKALENLCSDYEDTKFPVELRTALEVNGLDFSEYSDDDVLGKDVYNPQTREFTRIPNTDGRLWKDDFAHLYTDIAKLGNPDLKWEFVEENTINIGGYGLFSQ